MEEIMGYFRDNPAAFFVLLYFLTVNIWVFTLCALDKHRARRGLWRIRERTFFLLSALGGSVFMLFGMKLFRHKTKHFDFTVCIPLMLALQVVLIIYLQYKYGLVTWIFSGRQSF